MPSLLEQRIGPLQITLSLTRDVETFGQIANAGITLSGVNASYFDLPVFPAEFYFGRRNLTQIKSFHVESPPVATILADPAWLAVFLGLAALGLGALQTLAAYPQIKKAAPELYRDLQRCVGADREHVDGLVAGIQGLAEEEMEQVRRAVYDWLDATTKAPVEVAKRLLGRAIKLRRLVMGVAGRVLHIRVE